VELFMKKVDLFEEEKNELKDLIGNERVLKEEAEEKLENLEA